MTTATAPDLADTIAIIQETKNAPSDAVIVDSRDGAFLMFSSSGNLRLSLAAAMNDAKRLLRK